MRCPACGADVVEQAVYCHKCGERIDAMGAADAAEARPAGDAAAPTSENPFKKPVNGDGKNEPEKDIWRGGYSPKAMISGWAMSALFTLVLLLIGVFWVRDSLYWVILLLTMLLPWLYYFAVLTYRRMSVRYLLTTQRFIHESGVLRRVTNRIEAIDMDDITFEQGILQRLVGVGTIRIASSDRTDPQLELIGIEDVKHVAEMFDDVRRTERRRRSVHIEQI